MGLGLGLRDGKGLVLDSTFMGLGREGVGLGVED